MAATAVAGRPITGRTVLAIFLAFFGVVFTANFFLVRAALDSFGGVETDSSYKAGLDFKNDEIAAAAQAARHWEVDAHVDRSSFRLKALSAEGQPLSGLALSAALHHPSDRRLDAPITTTPAGPGAWTGTLEASPGQWNLVIELTRDGERVFRSVNRVVLK